tara:strand:- start:302 stop:1366 length:1065 start_codon:yes stop_codon:yes gene_type:complete
MANPNDKLDLDSITFDDVIGEGVSLQEEPTTSTEPIPENELDNDSLLQEEDGYQEENQEENQEDSPEEEGFLENIALEISNNLGIEREHEYDDTVDGLTEYVKDVSQEIAESQVEGLFEQYPEVQKHLDYLLAGGDSSKFFEANNPAMDYNNFELSERDSPTQKALLAQYFQAKGHEDDFIQEMLEDYEDSGKLFNKAQIAKNALAENQAYERTQLLESQQQTYQQQQDENNDFWDGVADVIEGGNEFHGVKIPDSEKNGFFDYISSPQGDQGATQRDLDYDNAPMETKLAIDYLLYSGFDLEGIIDTKARTTSAKNLRGRISRNEEQVRNAKGAQRRQSKTFDPNELDINSLF